MRAAAIARVVSELVGANVSNVPRLPLPALHDTLSRLLRNVSLFAPSPSAVTELAELHALAADFARASGQGPRLQRHLEAKAARPLAAGYPFSYVEDYWDRMYMDLREPLMVHVNPFFLLQPRPGASTSPAREAAAYAHAMVRWWVQVMRGELPPDRDASAPRGVLCRAQHATTFGSARLPAPGRDHALHAPDSRHIAVHAGGAWHALTVLDEGGGAALTQDALARLLADLAAAPRRPPNALEDAARLTAGGRERWARAREALLAANAANASALSALDRALFIVVLDDDDDGDVGGGGGETGALASDARALLHGGRGARLVRWYDKLQLIVRPSGRVGVCAEHSLQDGLSWARMSADVARALAGTGDGEAQLPRLAAWEPASAAECVRRLDAVAPNAAWRAAVTQAQDEAAALADDVALAIAHVPGGARDRWKALRVSPDAAMQLALQLAYVRCHDGALPAVYESCSTRAYFHGRTETIRSVTHASVQLMLAARDRRVAPASWGRLLRAAAAEHVAVAAGARTVSGRSGGFDRHCFALRCAASELGEAPHALWAHPLIARAGTWTLSTSNVTASHFSAFGFGAVTPVGYGVGYNIQADAATCCLTAFRSAQVTDAGALRDALVHAIADFDDALRSTD